MKYLIPFTKENVAQFISPRVSEIKIGESISLIKNNLASTPGKFVIIGISEDIGARANYGNAGAKNSWKAFLSKFLNMQANGFINTNEIIVQEAAVLDTSGNEIWFHSTISPVSEIGDKVEYLMVVSINTTAQNIAKTKLKKLNDELEIKINERTLELENKNILNRKKI